MRPAGIRNGFGAKETLRRYFQANPDEELTWPDMLVKFERCRKTLTLALAELIEEGELESVHVIRLREKGMK